MVTMSAPEGLLLTSTGAFAPPLSVSFSGLEEDDMKKIRYSGGGQTGVLKDNKEVEAKKVQWKHEEGSGYPGV